MKSYEEYVKFELESFGRAMAENAIRLTLARPAAERVWAILEEEGIEVDNLSVYIFNEPNFDRVTALIERLVAAGFDLEKLKVVDHPESRAKIVHVPLHDWITFYITFYASSSAPCLLIEKERIPQPDRIIYEMVCEEPAAQVGLDNLEQSA